jgi:hypothetical protein
MRESILDMDLTERIREIRRDESRAPIYIAGPAGNPTQPPEFCGNCGTHQGKGLAHASTCPNYVAPVYDDYGDCCLREYSVG